MPFDDLDILLQLQHLRHPVHIVDITAHYPDTGDIIDVLPRCLNGQRQPFIQQLGRKAFHRLYASLNVVNGVSCIEYLELIVQYFKFQRQLLYRGIIEVLHELYLIWIITKYGSEFCSYHLLVALPF